MLHETVAVSSSYLWQWWHCLHTSWLIHSDGLPLARDCIATAVSISFACCVNCLCWSKLCDTTTCVSLMYLSMCSESRLFFFTKSWKCLVFALFETVRISALVCSCKIRQQRNASSCVSSAFPLNAQSFAKYHHHSGVRTRFSMPVTLVTPIPD